MEDVDMKMRILHAALEMKNGKPHLPRQAVVLAQNRTQIRNTAVRQGLFADAINQT
jgi:hypothetical protein